MRGICRNPDKAGPMAMTSNFFSFLTIKFMGWSVSIVMAIVCVGCFSYKFIFTGCGDITYNNTILFEGKGVTYRNIIRPSFFRISNASLYDFFVGNTPTVAPATESLLLQFARLLIN